jgi:hypothetical protein
LAGLLAKPTLCSYTDYPTSPDADKPDTETRKKQKLRDEILKPPCFYWLKIQFIVKFWKHNQEFEKGEFQARCIQKKELYDLPLQLSLKFHRFNNNTDTSAVQPV